jgi:phenylpyruvate tautomerase PptA (4-oxalocrotonate tautomerase family)
MREAHPNVITAWVRCRKTKEVVMPLVRISLREGTTPEYRKAIADGVHQAMIDAIAIPPKDRFQVISEYRPGNLIYDADYLDVKRSDQIVLVQITLSTGRKPGQKRALFKRMAELMAKSPGLRPEDLLVNLVEVSWENWTFGYGEAQYQKD